MPQNVLGFRIDEIPLIETLIISDVEVLFIMVNREEMMEEISRSMSGQDVERELTSQKKEIEDNFDLHLYYSYKEVAEHNLGDKMVCERAGDWPLAKAVTSLDEVSEFVADWNIEHQGMKLYADEDEVIGS